MGVQSEIPLVLGGHSHIQQLGNEPKPTQSGRRALVAECLDRGISWFDTTYLPERVALGTALKELDRRSEAYIIAWNFFRTFDDEGTVGKASCFLPEHIEQMLGELQTDYIDCLVVHSVPSEEENRMQEEIARKWLKAGYVRRLGIWAPHLEQETELQADNPYTLMVKPYNVTTPLAGEVFAMGKRLGWENLACSPFVRGYKLDELVAREVKRAGTGADQLSIRSELADLMLRYSLFREHVDRLIVSIRKTEWVERNIASYRKGALTEEEERCLLALVEEL